MEQGIFAEYPVARQAPIAVMEHARALRPRLHVRRYPARATLAPLTAS